MAGLDACIGGERVHLDADRALVLDDAVLVADVHLDKAATFQRAGFAVPLGDEVRDLQRLAALARRHAAREILVLGDLVHAPPQPGGATERTVLQWFAAHPDLTVTVILGNHDRDAARRLAHWPVRWIEGVLERGPFRLRHEPCDTGPAEGYEIAGHVHPVLHLRDGPRDALRAPVFWARERSLLLPAFGSFTGGHAVRPARNDRLWAIAGETVIAVPAQT